MNGSVLRLLLVVLGWPGLVLALFLGQDAYLWVRSQYPMAPPVEHPDTARIQHPYYHAQALAALAALRRLPRAERVRFRAGLARHLMPLSGWLARLRRTGYGVLCLGEYHSERTRRFVATEIFDRLPGDALLLETTPAHLARIEQRLHDGWPYYPLHGADILAVLRASRRLDPAIRVNGIDETVAEAAQGTTRDVAIGENFWRLYRPGRRYLLLFGALHCSAQRGWLYRYLQKEAPSRMRLMNVRVLGEHQDGPLEGFVFFLDRLGLTRGDFVITDADHLGPRIRAWFPELAQYTLNVFASVVVFRPRPRGGAGA